METLVRNELMFEIKYLRTDQVNSVFHKFYLVHSWIPCPIYSVWKMIQKNLYDEAAIYETL